ncbi:sulfatase [Polaribacter batillariae]|uniref:Sulfatase n=1 Tax=Polaribacter batillariae TaxID=2808900 RepID=A0ABX7SWI1_9FLAO|nr:sulfatase [Polaribacter batillariae]QTD37683.1 sulfatase [Polaribacter batillariae]
MNYSIPIILLSCLFFSCADKQEEATKPNILFILSDDHTSQSWGIYGGVLEDYVQNKNIKRIATNGAKLNNVFCTNSICVPSRASILTGQYSHRNNIYTLSDALEPDSMNIAKVFQKNGYQTALFGKWHLKKQPAGFDDFLVLPGQGVYNNPILRTAANWPKGKEYQGFSTDVITDLSINWLKKRNSEQPFLLMTHFKATHEPFEYPERFASLYENEEIPEPETLYDFGPETTGRSFIGQKVEVLEKRWQAAVNDPKFWTNYPGLPFNNKGLDSIQLRKAIYQKFVKDFMRCGAAIDDNIGKLLNYLEESGLAENTVVIYTADQGYFLGEHGFFDKRLIYEESLRMPFVIQYPKEIKGGSTIDDIILNIDFAALFADYAGIKQPSFIQGESFRENLKGETPKNWRKDAYYRYWLHRTERPAHFGIRNNRYKLAFFYGQPLDMSGAMKQTTTPAWEFYDLEKDPNETHNAIDDEQYQTIIKEMKNRLQELREEIGDTDEQYPIMKEIIKENWNL